MADIERNSEEISNHFNSISSDGTHELVVVQQSKHEEELQNRLKAVEKDLQVAKETFSEMRVARFEDEKVTKQKLNDANEQLRQSQRQIGRLQVEVKISDELKDKAMGELNDTQLRLREVSQVNSTLQREVQRLQHLAESSDEERLTLQDNLTNVTETCHKLRDQKHELERKLKYCEEQLFDTITRSEVAEKNTSHAMEDMQNLIEEKDNLKKELDSAIAEMRSVSKVADEHNQHLKFVSENLEEQQQINANLKDKLTSLERSAKLKEAKIVELEKNVYQSQKRIKVQQEDYLSKQKKWETDIDILSNSESKLQSRVEELENTLIKVQKEHDKKELDTKGLTSRNHALEMQLTRIEDEKSDLEFHLSSLCSVIRRGLGLADKEKSKNDDGGLNSPEELVSAEFVEQALKDVSELINAIENQRDEGIRQVKALQKKLDENENKLTAQKDENNSLMQKCDANERAKERIEAQFDRTQTTITLQEEDLARKEKERKELLSRVSELQKSYHVVEMELHDAKTELQRTQSSSSKQAEDKRGLRLQLEDVESRLSKSEREARRLHVDLEAVTNKNEELKTENESLCTQLDRMISDNKDLAKRLICTENKCSRYETDMAIHVDDNRLLRETVRSLENAIDEKCQNAHDFHNIIKATREQMDKIELENSNLSKLLDESQREREKDLDKINEMQRFRSKAEQHATASDDELHRMATAYKEQTSTMKELLHRVASLQEEKKVLEHRLKGREKQPISTTSKDITVKGSANRKKQDVIKLKELLHKTENDRTNMEKHFIDVVEENSVLDKNLKQAKTENMTLRDRLDQAEAVLARDNLIHHRVGQYSKEKPQHDYYNRQQSHTHDRDSYEVNYPVEKRYDDEQDNPVRHSISQSVDTLASDAKQLRQILDKSLHRLGRNNNRKPTSDDDTQQTYTMRSEDTRKPTKLSLLYGSNSCDHKKSNRPKRDSSPSNRVNRKTRQPPWIA